MNERIEKLVEKTVAGQMFVYPVKTEYDRCDLFLSPVKMSGKKSVRIYPQSRAACH